MTLAFNAHLQGTEFTCFTPEATESCEGCRAGRL